MSLEYNPKLAHFLNELFDTNLEFASHHDDEFFAHFRDKQTPYLTILKCSDSRVQMESFDKTPQNGVFAIRNIGNQFLVNEGSVDFGVRVLKTPFLLIIGHSGCGAVETVLSSEDRVTKSIEHELRFMKLKSTCMKEAIVENINKQVDHAVKKYNDLIESGELCVVGAVYDFKDDFGFGKGMVVLTSLNGETNTSIVESNYLSPVKNLRFLE